MTDFLNTSPGRILISDNDEPFRASLAAWLQRQGFECVEVSDGAVALQLLRAARFDALIADILMPGRDGHDGLELAEQVQALADGLPVFLLTAEPSLETAMRSVRLPITAYLVKPPNHEELLALLRRSILNYRHLCLLNRNRDALHSWDAKLETIASTLRRRQRQEDHAQVKDYLQVTLHNLLVQLARLEESVSLWSRSGVATLRKQELDLIGALQQTVDVLRQTKQDFKSRKLADLREQLEDLLGSGQQDGAEIL